MLDPSLGRPSRDQNGGWLSFSLISDPLGILLALLFKLANKYGEELGEGLIQQVLVKPTQITPDPRQHDRIREGVAGSAIQTNRPVEARNNLHHITIGQRTLRPSILFAVGEPEPLPLYDNEQTCPSRVSAWLKIS